MTGRELRDALNQLPEEELNKGIYFTYNYGDYWHTVIAGDITRIDEGFAEWSDYHSKMSVANEPEPDEDDENLTDEEIEQKYLETHEKVKRVLLLS